MSEQYLEYDAFWEKIKDKVLYNYFWEEEYMLGTIPLFLQTKERNSFILYINSKHKLNLIINIGSRLESNLQAKAYKYFDKLQNKYDIFCSHKEARRIIRIINK